ncbi:glycosyltransferase family 39 protein [Leptothoe sp. PORK10 BA2]|uniref:glycosyltransferase family 39 protein n=1 Tax=Leptothoe sp. PORK10 BA2 TaxID=3110254 RepID=UPI002B1ECEC4|nr:glycosyltransferase family 39 protein [Leptothoe sp. PORK10 BA2]MEA5466859.1 glycosyltransferase family 39 protein [Leptothoe sp. PORK10 BA2]
MSISTKPKQTIQWWLIGLILIISLARFINLGTKPYWSDEVYTSLRLSGYTKQEVFESAQGEPKPFSTLAKFQCVGSDRNFNDTLNGLITDDVHPPLYFFLSYYWAKLTGCSVVNLRLIAAAISLLVLPLGYGLTYELFGCTPTAGLATLFMAASPILLVYAQEARPYSLLTVLSLLSTLLLLRLRPDRCPGAALGAALYIAYGVTSVAGLYCHTLYYLTLACQGFYCFLGGPALASGQQSSWQRSSWRQWRRRIAISMAISWSIFALWLARVAQLQGFTITVGADYTWDSFSMQQLWQRIGFNFCNLIYDFYHPLKTSLLASNSVNQTSGDILASLGWPRLLLGIGVGLILLYSLVYAYRRSPPGCKALLGWLAAPSVLFLVKDLVLGGNASSVVRYQLLTVCALYICLAFCLVSQYQRTQGWLAKFGLMSLMVGLVQLQLYSNWVYLQAPTWWSKMNGYQLYQVALLEEQTALETTTGQIGTGQSDLDDLLEHLGVQQLDQLWVVSANPKDMIRLLKLSHVLPPTTMFQLLPPEKFAELFQGEGP